MTTFKIKNHKNSIIRVMKKDWMNYMIFPLIKGQVQIMVEVMVVIMLKEARRGRRGNDINISDNKNLIKINMMLIHNKFRVN